MEEELASLEELRIFERSLRAQARENSQLHLSRKLSEIQHTLTRLDSQQTSLEIRLLKLQDQLHERQGELTRRRRLKEAARRSLIEAREKNVIERRDGLLASKLLEQEECRLELANRRSALVVELSTIYPIEPISSSTSPPSSIHNPSSVSRLLLFSIANIVLPKLEPAQSISNKPSSASAAATTTTTTGAGTTPSLIYFFHSKPPELADDDLIVSTALGFVAHLVQLLALYLAVPLLYPISFIGSRSLVSDLVSRLPGPRSFPLYFKGVDRFRFDYAVFLLNKNIEQIMYHEKVVVSDLRHTLPNLKILFLTLESGPITRTGVKENDTSTIELVTSHKHTEVEEVGCSSPSPKRTESQPVSPTCQKSLSPRSSSSKDTQRQPSTPQDLPQDDADDCDPQTAVDGSNGSDNPSLKSSHSASSTSPAPSNEIPQNRQHQHNHVPHHRPYHPSRSPSPSFTTHQLSLHHDHINNLQLNPQLHLSTSPSPSEKEIAKPLSLHLQQTLSSSSSSAC